MLGFYKRLTLQYRLYTAPKHQRRLDDILRTCRASDKPKLPATPTMTTTMTTPSSNPTRRQLFTPNIGYEDTSEAKRIVDQAIDTNSLDQLEIVYLPGTNVHKRVQEVKRQLGIGVVTPKAKPVFTVPTPKTAPPAKTVERAKKVPATNTKIVSGGKCSFLKSLEPQISREHCDNEAFFYRENFAKNKEQLATLLYNMFNAQVFNNELSVPLIWSARLRNTAGRCKNKNK